MASPQDEIVKTGSNTLKQIGNQSGPWAVLFLAVIAVVIWYIHSEKTECSTEMKQIKADCNQLSIKLVSTQLELANCQAQNNSYKVEYSNQPKSKRR